MSTSPEIERYPRLNGKNVLITGASAGIGRAAALGFAASGSRVIISARRTEKLVELKEEIESTYGTPVFSIALDVQKSDAECQKALDELPEEFKNIQVLVNNAGLALGKNLTHETPEDHVDTMIDTNVKGVLRMIRLVVPGMLSRNDGHIINVGSVAGVEAYRGGSVYCATKHAVQAINTSLRKETAQYSGVRVTVIQPGLVETEFSIVRHSGDKDAADATYKGMDPLVGADIADNILYAASRPAHVQIAELLVFPQNQASCEVTHRGE